MFLKLLKSFSFRIQDISSPLLPIKHRLTTTTGTSDNFSKVIKHEIKNFETTFLQMTFFVFAIVNC